MESLILPKVIHGTSALGNLHKVISDEVKLSIVSESIKCGSKPTVFDSAGKYGAGLALESLGNCLKQLNIDPATVIIINKLGWLRTELKAAEPTFDLGMWKDLTHGAVQKISYEGILECYAQGNELLNGYKAQLVSVHEPDEYIAAASSPADAENRYEDILAAYRALYELKDSGQVKAIGIEAKDWQLIQKVSQTVKLDWVMIANNLTIQNHHKPLVAFVKKLEAQGVSIINSTVFSGGFLTGLDFYNCQPVSPEKNAGLYHWREMFYQMCKIFNIEPAAACIAFGIKVPGVKSIALSSTNAAQVSQNLVMAVKSIPFAFWNDMAISGLIDRDYVEKYLIRK